MIAKANIRVLGFL